MPVGLCLRAISAGRAWPPRGFREWLDPRIRAARLGSARRHGRQGRNVSMGASRNHIIHYTYIYIYLYYIIYILYFMKKEQYIHIYILIYQAHKGLATKAKCAARA